MAESRGCTGLGASPPSPLRHSRAVRHLATVVAGAYPLRRPPDAWSPGLPAPPGPCYWLVASGTPMGWRGGCLAAGLVRSTVCYYCLGGWSALVMSARRSRQVWGVGASAVSCFCPWAPPCPRVLRGACCGLSCPGAPSLCLPVRHSMRSVRSAGLVRSPFGSALRVRCVFVRWCSRGARASPSLWVGVARALRAVPVQGAGRAVEGGSRPSAFPASDPGSAFFAHGGVARSLRPLALLGAARPPACRPDFVSWLCALWARHEGARGEMPLSCVWGARGWALFHARPPFLERAAGARYPLAVGAGAVGVATCQQPHSARSCGLALRAVGAARGRLGGGSLAWL